MNIESSTPGTPNSCNLRSYNNINKSTNNVNDDYYENTIHQDFSKLFTCITEKVLKMTSELQKLTIFVCKLDSDGDSRSIRQFM